MTKVRFHKKPDDRKPEVNVVAVGAGEVGLPSKEYYSNTKVSDNYKKAMAQMMNVIFTGEIMTYAQIANDTPTKYLPIAQKIWELEKKMANASPDPDVASEISYTYNVVNLEDMDKKLPEISISKLLKALAPADYTIKTVINNDPYYYGNISTILKSTPRETLHGYFQYRLIATWSGRLHKDYTRPARVMSNSLAGKAPDAVAERWRSCVAEIDSALGWFLSGAFVQRAFSAQAKSLGDRIVSDIKNEFTARLKNVNWMGEETKKIAAKKVANIVQKIGYPTASPNVVDPADLKKWYEKLDVSDNYFNNGRAMAAWGSARSWADLPKPVDKARWGMSAPTVNAYYSPSGNEIVFPAGQSTIPQYMCSKTNTFRYNAIAGL